jgi:hypothetical protein
MNAGVTTMFSNKLLCGSLSVLAVTMAAAVSPAVAASAGVVVTSVTAGAGDPNGKVPAINAVPGAGVNNADLSFPLAVLTHGAAYYVQITSQNTTGSGTCKDSFKLTQVQSGQTVTLLSGAGPSYACAPGNIFAYYIGSKAVPNSPGPATLTGTVAVGKSKASFKASVIIQ